MNQLLREYASRTTNEGRMENMNQLLKKFALLTACAALALCFTTRPAQAQDVMEMVEPGGTGEHLFFAYWTVDNYTNTSVNIHSPLGMYGADNPTKNAVYVRVRSAAADRNIVASFMICLNPGDSWTATLSMDDGLMVMDEGECDGDLRELASNPGNQNVATPTMDGDPVDLGATTSGYIEAWLNPVNALKDGADEGFNPDNATPRYISGTAMLVSPMSGFSSSYNAVALSMCGNTVGAADAPDATSISAAITPADGATPEQTATALANDDGDGSWMTRQGSDTAAENDMMGAPITRALMMQDRDLLTGRWTAIDDENVMSHTKVVLTFPVPHLGVSDGTSDPLTLHIYDDMGNIVHRGTGLTLPLGVNMCMFGGMDMMGMLSCNGEDVAELGDAISGEFRILNNKAIGAPDRTGGELGGLGTMDTVTEEDADTDILEATTIQAAQYPAESLNAIGLVFSYFMGTDGTAYDQVTPIQWVNIDMNTTAATGEADDDTGTMP